MKHLRGIVESPTAPNTTDVLWLDADGGLKAFKNGKWKALVEKGSGGNNNNNIYYLYHKFEDGAINWYNKDNKLLFTTSDRNIDFSDIDDVTFENYFNCSVNDFHNIYDKIIVTNLSNGKTVIVDKMLTSDNAYYGIVYINGVADMAFMFSIQRTMDATNYIKVIGMVD